MQKSHIMRIDFALIILLIIVLLACSRPEKLADPQVINLQKATGTLELKLSDLMTNIHLIALETKDESLIGSYSRYLVGEKYIVCSMRDKVLQFSYRGKYLRCLTKQGGAPDEFVYLSSYQMDPNERTFYFLDENDNKIKRISLTSGMIGKPIPIWHGIAAENFTLVSKNKLAIFPSNGNQSDYFVFYQDTLGNFLTGVKFKRDFINQPVYYNIHPQNFGDNLIYYFTKIWGDTIVIINDREIKPLVVLQGGRKLDMKATYSEGYTQQIISLSKEIFLLANSFISKKEMVLSNSEKYYAVIGDNLDLFEIITFTNDYLGFKYSDESLNKVAQIKFCPDNQMVFFKINSQDLLKEQSEYNLDSLESKERIYIDSIFKSLSIYDNPILLIGKIPKNQVDQFRSRIKK